MKRDVFITNSAQIAPLLRILCRTREVNPITHEVDLDGAKWSFPQRPDFGGYVREGDRFVQILKLNSG